jgi:predicted RND superfamily exporter protein
MKSIGFGLERVALQAVDRPWIAAALLAVVLAIAGYGLTKPRFDDNLRNVFGGSTAEVTAYLEATRQFVDPENQLVLLVDSTSLGKAETFASLRELQFELQFVDGVRDVFSLFALRDPPEETGLAKLDAPLIVDDSVTELTPEIVARIRSHPILGRKLLSEDATTMLYVVTPEQEAASLPVLREFEAEIEAAAKEALAGSDATLTITGFPAIRINIVDTLVRDTRVLNTAGAIIGFVLSLLIFGSFSAACMIAVPAVLSGLVVIGGLGAVGVPITVLSNSVPVLVIIFGFAHSMHLCRAWRLSRDAGKGLADSARDSITIVGPACVLAALTTAVAFLSLVFSDVRMVSDFGWVGATGCMVGVFFVLTMHVLVALTVGRFWKARGVPTWTFMDWLGAPSASTGRFAADYARPICCAVVLLVLVFGAMYAAVEPEYSVREHLGENNPANAGLKVIDDKLGGAFPVHIIVPLHGEDPTSAEALLKIGAVHRAVASVEGVGTPLSLWSLVEWLGDADSPRQDRLEHILENVAPATLQRFIGANGDALVSVSVRDAPAAAVKDLVERIEAVVHSAAGQDAVVTGVTVVVAREATRTIGNLNGNLLGTILSGLLAILIAFRSWRIAATSVIPNILPLLGTGTLIYLFGRGMQFSSILALTIAFGIAVDATIHYFNYYFYFGDESKSLRENLIETSRRIGPQLIGTTVVIVVGLMTTQLSHMPTIALFGRLVAATLVIGLVGALVVLPALMAGAARRWFTKHPTIQPAARSAA